MNDFIFQNSVSKMNLAKNNLSMTRLAAGLYFILQNEDTSRIVELCATKDWGDNTACVFEQNKIIVENLDGRIEEISK